MSHIQYIDELVREYLLFRGLSNTLKSYDYELKNDKDRGFRVDKIVDQIAGFILSSDLHGLKELWGHLDNLLFSKLEQQFTPAIRKLEYGVLKYYLIAAISNNRNDKVTDFFTKLTPDLQSQVEWKDWFVIPYVKSPEENPMFALYFTKQWQDTLLVSLYNMLATVFQCMPQPTLSGIDTESSLIRRLQEENNHLRNRLVNIQENYTKPIQTQQGYIHKDVTTTTHDASHDLRTRMQKPILNLHDVVPLEVTPPTHIVDDFYIIAQESSHNLYSEYGSQQARSLKSLIRNIGSGGSPVMGRKEIPSEKNKKRSGSVGSTRPSTYF